MAEKRITVFVDSQLHTQFKVKVAQDGTTAKDVVTALVAEYVAGRVKVKPPKANGKKAKA